MFGAKMTTAKYAFSICANRGFVAIIDITAPHTHGELSWPTGWKRKYQIPPGLPVIQRETDRCT
jgi:hypothetical protein